MVTRRIRWPSSPVNRRRGTLARATSSPTRQLRNLAGHRGRCRARPGGSWRPAPQPRPPGRASGMNHAVAAANGAANLTHRQTRNPHRRLIMALNEDKLNEFLGRFVTDLGATVAAGNVVIGHELGLYRALAYQPPRRGGLAQRDPHQSAVHRRMAPRAGSGRLRRVRRSASDTYSMTEKQALRPDQPGRRLYGPGALCWRSAPCGHGRGSPRPSAPARPGLARARRRRLHRLRAVLPPRLHRQPDPVLDPGPGRRGGQAPVRQGRRHRLRARRLDHPPRPGVPELGLHRVGLSRPGLDPELARKRAGDAGVADRVSFEVARPHRLRDGLRPGRDVRLLA